MPELEIMSISQRLGTAIVAVFAIAFTRAPRLVRLANPVMRRVLVTRLPAGPNVLLEVRGRTSGLLRALPVAYLDLGDRSYVQGASGGVDWVRNLRAAGECVMVGDRIETDIVMGKRLGLATVLVLSGITAAGDPRIAEIAPDLVLPSIRELIRS